MTFNTGDRVLFQHPNFEDCLGTVARMDRPRPGINHVLVWPDATHPQFGIPHINEVDGRNTFRFEAHYCTLIQPRGLQIGDQVWYTPKKTNTWKQHYIGTVEQLIDKDATVHFYATGFDSNYKEGYSFGLGNYPMEDLTRVGTSTQTISPVQQKINYLWKKSKWVKTHPNLVY